MSELYKKKKKYLLIKKRKTHAGCTAVKLKSNLPLHHHEHTLF